MIDMTNLINEIGSLVKGCGKVILNADREKMAIDIKSGVTDLVTEYDKKVQEQLEIGLKKLLPEAKFIGEEGSKDELTGEGYAFVVDPIDGTTNFIKDYQMSCISVAYVVDAEVVYQSSLTRRGRNLSQTLAAGKHIDKRRFANITAADEGYISQVVLWNLRNLL